MCDGWKMKFEVVLPSNKVKGEFTEHYFFQTLSLYLTDSHLKQSILKLNYSGNKINLKFENFGNKIIFLIQRILEAKKVSCLFIKFAKRYFLFLFFPQYFDWGSLLCSHMQSYRRHVKKQTPYLELLFRATSTFT